MTEETPKKIDWKEIIATSKISILWYIVISFIWWIMGIYPHILFSLGGQLVIAGLASPMSFLHTKK